MEVFLQGSYANHTNTRGDSDVDVVVMSTTTVIPDTSLLTPSERERQRAAAEPASLSLLGFRKLVEQALVDYFGSQRVHSKEKCLRVDKRAGYVDADVVPAFEVQRYTSYPSYGAPVFVEGIAIRPLSEATMDCRPRSRPRTGPDGMELTRDRGSHMIGTLSGGFVACAALPSRG